MVELRNKYIRIIYMTKNGKYFNLLLDIEGLPEQEVEEIINLKNDYTAGVEFINNIGMGEVYSLDFCYTHIPKYISRIIGKVIRYDYHEQDFAGETRQERRDREKKEDELEMEKVDTLVKEINKQGGCRMVIIGDYTGWEGHEIE